MAHVTREIIVNAPVSTVFSFWKNFENFPRFMENIESIEVTGPELTHWKMKGPLGTSVEWDAKTLLVEENKKISWKSVEGTIETHGAVLFEPLDNDRTRVTVVGDRIGDRDVGAVGHALGPGLHSGELGLGEDRFVGVDSDVAERSHPGRVADLLRDLEQRGDGLGVPHRGVERGDDRRVERVGALGEAGLKVGQLRV